MRWTKPDFVEISLGTEVTAYANTDDRRHSDERPARTEEPPPSHAGARADAR
jgi:coenzyme PQQ precursor peptide PqqA